MGVAPNETVVLLVDAQTHFLEMMHGAQEPVLARMERLVRFAELLDLPVVVTLEHPVEQKGGLPERLESALPETATHFVKTSFDCMAEEPIRKALDRPCVAVAGGETDVCILQSVLALLDAGHRVFLLEDCLFSSEPDVGPALRRMEAAGAMPATFKSFAYEITAKVEAAWPAKWRERLAQRPELFPPPEDLPRA